MIRQMVGQDLVRKFLSSLAAALSREKSKPKNTVSTWMAGAYPESVGGLVTDLLVDIPMTRIVKISIRWNSSSTREASTGSCEIGNNYEPHSQVSSSNRVQDSLCPHPNSTGSRSKIERASFGLPAPLLSRYQHWITNLE